MAEEKSIFSKLKPINLGEEISQISSGNIQNQSPISNQVDLSIKNELTAIKEKISLLENILTSLEKKHQLIIEDEKIKKELIFYIEDYSKKIAESIIKSLKNEFLEDINQILNKILVEEKKDIVEELKSLKNKIESKSIKNDITVVEDLDNLNNEKNKFVELINRVEDIDKKLIILNNIISEMKSFIDKTKTATLELNATLLRENKLIEKTIIDEVSSINGKLIEIAKEVDKYNQIIEKLFYFENKSFLSKFELIIKELKNLLSSTRDLKERIYSDENLKNNSYLKKYLVYFVEIESNISKIESFLIKFLKNLK